MSRVVPIAIILMLAFSASAQKRFKQQEIFVKRGTMNIQGGLSIPVMDFADDNFELASGYAQPGANIKLGLSYDIAPFLGLALQYQYNKNPFNNSGFLDDLKTVSAGSSLRFNSYTSDPWTLQGLMIGVYYPFKAYRTSIDFKVLTGFLTGVLPENTVNYTDLTVNRDLNIKQFEISNTSISYQAGLNIRYQLYKSLLLTGSADFTYTEITYRNIVIEDTYSKRRGYLPDYTQYYHIINLSAGIGIQFD
jgi:hypothetical protein